MSLDIIRIYQARVAQALDLRLPADDVHPYDLHRAMRYAVLGGGKRIRPALVYLAGAVTGATVESLDGAACAVELIHAYSLIHDDLPAMDNDDLRHGRPSCHKVFGEAIALLAGDALQALAFQILARGTAMLPDPGIRLKMVEILSQAAGSHGMAGGQAIDLAATGQTLTLTELEAMHSYKTGALIRASVLLGAMSRPDVDPSILERLDRYAKCIGLAFQIRDDILNVIGDTATLGKTQGSDHALGKPTYPVLLGLDGAREHARILHEEAQLALDMLGAEAEPLRWLSHYIVERMH